MDTIILPVNFVGNPSPQMEN